MQVLGNGYLHTHCMIYSCERGFHNHKWAIRQAERMNHAEGYKRFKITVRDQHFQLVLVKR